MAKPFKGTINVDIRDSEPDWTPFEPPRAPDGAPNVLYIVLDDVGFSAMSCYGGPIDTPNIDRIAAAGVRYTMIARVARTGYGHSTMTATPPVEYAQSGGVHVAYQVIGEGDLDLVLVQGFASHLDVEWENPAIARFFRGLELVQPAHPSSTSAASASPIATSRRCRSKNGWTTSER